MKYIVDRIEGAFAICEAEDQLMVDIPLCKLPVGIKEGTNLKYENGKYQITANDPNRKKHIQKMMNDLWR